MAMNLHTDRVDRTIGDRDNFGKIWAWTALAVFFATVIAFEGSNSDSMMPSTGFGFHAATVGIAAFAAVFPGVMIAALLKGLGDFFED